MKLITVIPFGCRDRTFMDLNVLPALRNMTVYLENK